MRQQRSARVVVAVQNNRTDKRTMPRNSPRGIIKPGGVLRNLCGMAYGTGGLPTSFSPGCNERGRSACFWQVKSGGHGEQFKLQV